MFCIASFLNPPVKLAFESYFWILFVIRTLTCLFCSKFPSFSSFQLGTSFACAHDRVGTDAGRLQLAAAQQLQLSSGRRPFVQRRDQSIVRHHIQLHKSRLGLFFFEFWAELTPSFGLPIAAFFCNLDF